MKQRAVKMPDELWEQVKAQAAKSDLSAGQFIRRVLADAVTPGSEVHRWSADEAVEKLNKIREARAENAAEVLDQIVATRPFKCPTYGCDYEAASAAARCPHHARLVVPV